MRGYPRVGPGLVHGLMLVAFLRPDSANAGTPSAAVGYSYYQAAENHVTQALIAEATVSLPEAEVTMAALRYDDDTTGEGVGLLGGLGLRMAPRAMFRLLGGAVAGDGDYRAWRIKAGPQLASSRAALQVSYQRYQDNRDFHSNAVVLESGTVLSSRLTVRMSASHAATSLGLSSSQASAGMAWMAVPHLELSADLGVARNGALVASGGGPGPLLPLPLLAEPGNGSVSASETLSPTVQLGVRLLFP